MSACGRQGGRGSPRTLIMNARQLFVHACPPLLHCSSASAWPGVARSTGPCPRLAAACTWWRWGREASNPVSCHSAQTSLMRQVGCNSLYWRCAANVLQPGDRAAGQGFLMPLLQTRARRSECRSSSQSAMQPCEHEGQANGPCTYTLQCSRTPPPSLTECTPLPVTCGRFLLPAAATLGRSSPFWSWSTLRRVSGAELSRKLPGRVLSVHVLRVHA